MRVIAIRLLPTVLLAFALAGFMTADRLALHWYSRDTEPLEKTVTQIIGDPMRPNPVSLRGLDRRVAAATSEVDDINTRVDDMNTQVDDINSCLSSSADGEVYEYPYVEVQFSC